MPVTADLPVIGGPVAGLGLRDLVEGQAAGRFHRRCRDAHSDTGERAEKSEQVAALVLGAARRRHERLRFLFQLRDLFLPQQVKPTAKILELCAEAALVAGESAKCAPVAQPYIDNFVSRLNPSRRLTHRLLQLL